MNSQPARFLPWARTALRALRDLHARERRRVRAELAQIPAFVLLLAKAGTGRAWNRAERETLRRRWRGMGRLGLYLTTMIFPGTTLTLPLLAWWLDRRDAQQAMAVSEANPCG